jgi:hypothetical protein
LVGCTSQQPDEFLPLRAFRPSSSESADRGRSNIQVSLLVNKSHNFENKSQNFNILYIYQARSCLYAKNQLLAHHFGKKKIFLLLRPLSALSLDEATTSLTVNYVCFAVI